MKRRLSVSRASGEGGVMDEYEIESERLDAELKPLLTDEFLDTLVKAACTIGWLVDFTEISSFVESCFEIAGKECPPFDTFQLGNSPAPPAPPSAPG
jgi:hypothetical protein